MPRFIGKLFLFLALAVFAQWLVVRVTGTAYTPEMYRELQEALAGGSETIMLGDSTISYVASDDTDKRTIPAMLDDQMPGNHVFSYWHEAYHPEVFLPLCESVVRGEHHPRNVVLIVNLRCFLPVWDACPNYQFERDITVLTFMNTPFDFLLRPTLVFGAFLGDSITFPQYYRCAVYDGDTAIGVIADFPYEAYQTFTPENLRRQVVTRYMGNIDPEHPKIVALMECIRVLQMNGIHTFAYVTPVDWQSCRDSVGDRFVTQLDKNVAVIEQAVRTAGGTFLDCSQLLHAEAFDWEVDLYPNEHLNEEGRMALVQTLRAWIDEDQANQ